MKKKIKILRLITTTDPKYGGPTNAIIDSSLMLKKQGFVVHILTCDTVENNFVKKKIKVINKGPSLLGRYGFNIKISVWLNKNKNKYDVFIIHGIWGFNSLLARLILKNYYVFTHGFLDPFFKKDFLKRIKKQIYWFCIEKKNLIKARSILLTSKGENESLKKTFVNTDGIKKKIIKYGIQKPKLKNKENLKAFFAKFPNLKRRDFLLFLGRFHEKKGCEIIVEAVKKIKNFKKIILLAGPVYGNYYETKIQNLIIKYNLQHKIIFSDALFGKAKWGALLASRGSILASRGENFGVSLVESLSLGKPVITTDKVNIYKEIIESKAGLIAKDEVKSFTKILH